MKEIYTEAFSQTEIAIVRISLFYQSTTYLDKRLLLLEIF